jgi:hypothetical protein
MAAPNIVGVTAITGKTAVLAVTTAATVIVTNSAASGKVLKINTLNIANINGTTAADITVDLFRGSVAYRLLLTVSVPADASLVAISKDTSIYLEEGDSLRLTASANSFLEGICSYEDIS